MKRLIVFCLWVGFCIGLHAQRPVNIVYIGNSITEGAYIQDKEKDAPPARASYYVSEQLGTEVEFRNCGISGMTTVDFLPICDHQFPNVLSAASELARRNGILLFSISLGTNDSACSTAFGAPVPPEQYYTNLKAIIDELLKKYPDSRIVVQSPIWYSPNTYNAAIYLSEGLKRLTSYLPMIPRLIDAYAETNPGHVFLGDTQAFGFFKEHYLELFRPEEGKAGTFYLHPNRKGADRLGKFWAEAILKALQYAPR